MTSSPARRHHERGIAGEAPLRTHLRPVVGALEDRPLQVRGDPDVYLMFPPAGDGGIAGGLMPARGLPTYACFGVEVDDVDDSYRHALELGATSMVEPSDNPGGVRSAYVRDPDGNIFTIYRFVQPSPPNE